MKKQIISLGALLIVSSLSAQMQFKVESDTIKIQQIEDLNMHKTGNPNTAKPMSSKSNLTIMENPQPVAIVTHEVIEQQQANN